MTSILVIPDSHAKPDANNDRFSALGNFIVDKRPDYVVDIGDSADMPSLSRYDVGTVHAEGRRYADDIAAYHDAQDKLWLPTSQYNKRRKANKKKMYYPRRIKCTGNHEERINRAASADPSMYGHLSMGDLRESRYGWDVFPFLKPAVVEGIVFQHYFTSGVMGRPIGGENHAASLVKKGHVSCVAGHSHMRDFWETTTPKGDRIFGLVVGCYVDAPEHYTTEQDRWWSGIVILEEVSDGYAEPHFYSIDYIKDNYG